MYIAGILDLILSYSASRLFIDFFREPVASHVELFLNSVPARMPECRESGSKIG